eukprot:1138768-Pelagomonas_calceolata.AAC.2
MPGGEDHSSPGAPALLPAHASAPAVHHHLCTVLPHCVQDEAWTLFPGAWVLLFRCQRASAPAVRHHLCIVLPHCVQGVVEFVP